MMRSILILIVVGTVMSYGMGGQGKELEHRWLYLSTNLLVEENVDEAVEILARAAKSGYNGVLLADYKFNILDRMPERYFRNAIRLKLEAERLGLEIIPAVMPIGYSNGLLAHNPNLAEGLPVYDAVFIVKDGEADILPDPQARLKNGDLEEVNGNRFIGWSFQDGIGRSTFADRSTVHGGRVSVRMEHIGQVDPRHGNCRLSQEVEVKPFRYYHISAWIKSEGFDNPGGVRILVLDHDGRPLHYINLGVKPTQDWTEHHVVFNSLDNRKVRVYIGVWGGKGGRLWWDDVRMEEIGLVNVLRRDGCPLTVKGEDGTVYKEGRDFEPVEDEKLGAVPWPGEFEVYHEPPKIRLTPNSRIKEGQRLLVSFYHPVIIYGGQVSSCLSEPEVYRLLEDQVRRVNDLFKPSGFMMSHDELRVVNWCKLCLSRDMTPGELLADNARRCIEIIRRVNPDARIYVWSDMFDPHHNAHDGYYLVNGDLSGSWEGLTGDVVIVNWNFRDRGKSLPWFARRGHKQILAGYYDSSRFYTPQWLEDARKVGAEDSVIGVMYTTWIDNYDDLEGFAEAVWGR
jgi:hypothetical protein